MSIQIRQFAVMTLLFSFFLSTSYAQQANTGWIEKVNVGKHNLLMTAKIDSGADNSSIHALHPERYEKNGKPWVRFTLNSGTGQATIIDEPIIKTTRIKMKNKAVQERLVIELDVCLDNIRKRVPVNLSDRSHFNYQLLIGRSFLKSDFLIDSGKKFMTKSCSSYI
ncbi:MAG: RimK/LysX family protein [Gammaproteobacteria bacterium]|nr:RimK/LysX family protein [Gammaproteobacteria bacterium]